MSNNEKMKPLPAPLPISDPPIVTLAMLILLSMTLRAVTLFGVPVSGSFLTLAAAMLLFCLIATGMGLLVSAGTKSQIAAVFFAMVNVVGGYLVTDRMLGMFGKKKEEKE